MIRSFPLSDTATFMRNKIPSLVRRAAKLRLGLGFDGPNMCHAWAFLDRGCDSYTVLLMLALKLGWLSFPVAKVRWSAAYLCHCHWCKGDARNVQRSTFNKPASFQASQAITLFPTASLHPAGSRRLYSIRYHLCKARAKLRSAKLPHISSFEISSSPYINESMDHVRTSASVPRLRPHFSLPNATRNKTIIILK